MNFKKIIALITAVCFLTAFTGQSFAQAVAQDKGNSAILAMRSDTFAERFGKITEFENYNSPQVIVNIQDLHAHPQTQKNIASILQALDEKYEIKRVYAEGASGKIDVSWLYPYSNSELNKNIVLQMVENGTLTGSEYFAFLNKKDNLFGLEDAKIHHQNIVRLGTIYANEKTNLRIASNVKNEIDYLANKNLNADMKKLSKDAAAYHGNKMTSAQYYKTLLGYAGKINQNPLNYSNAFNIDPESFTEIKKVIIIDEQSKKLNAKHINSQLQKYLAELKNNLSVSEYRTLLNSTDNLNDLDMFFKYISASGLVAKDNSELAAFVKLKELNSAVNPLSLFAQEQKLEEQIRRSLAASEIEKEVSFLNDFYVFFEGYLTNKLTAKDEEYFKRNFDTFASLYAKYASVNHIHEIRDQFAFLDDYYNANNKRNEIFIKKINENDKIISGNVRSAASAENILNNAKEIIIIVTGGYHTLGISEILDAKNVSHITITPKISESTELADINYRQIIADQSRIYKEALSFVIASQTADVQRYKNIVEAGATYLGNNMSFDNLDALIDEISGIVGEEGIISSNRIDSNNTEIHFPNGAILALSRGENNEVTVKSEASTAAETVVSADVRLSEQKILDAYFDLAKTLTLEAFGNLYGVSVLDIESEPIYQAAKEIFTIKAHAGADFGVDGAIAALEEYASAQMKRGQTLDNVKTALTVDGISYEILSRLPEFFQKAVLERQINKDMSDKGITVKKKNALSRALKKLSMMTLAVILTITLSSCAANGNQKKVESTTESSITQQQEDAARPAYVSSVVKSQVVAGKIIVTNEKGEFIDYTIKGICYSRDLKGETYYQNYMTDLPLLKNLGINSIRTYRPLAAYTNGNLDIAKTKEMLDAFQAEGITVTVGFSYEDMVPGGLMEQYLKEFGNHPAILTIALGNEYNYHYGEWFGKEEWMSRLTEAVGKAKQAAPNKIIAVVHGEMPSAQEVKEYKAAGVDLLMLNMYRGPSFTNAKKEWATLGTNMPWVLGEFGRSSKAADGSDTSATQAEFLEKQIAGMNMGYIFSFIDEPWKGNAALDDGIGAENALGVYNEDGSDKPATSVVKKEFAKIADGADGYYIDAIPEEKETTPGTGTTPETETPHKTEEKNINTDKVAMYGDDSWRAYSLNLGTISLDTKGELVIEVETIDAGSNPAARIEIRNIDSNGTPISSSNILLPQTYKLADKGATVTIAIPYSYISTLNFTENVELVISTGKVFGGQPLNTEKLVDIKLKAAKTQRASLELPFFAFILNKLGITKQKYPKVRAAIIAAVEAPLILMLSPKAFARMHGKTTKAIDSERLERARDMKSKARQDMNAGAVFGAVLALIANIGMVNPIISVFVFGFLGISAELAFMFAVMLVPFFVAGSITLAGLISIVRTHYHWNLANPKTTLDSNVQINMIYAKKRSLSAFHDKMGVNAVVNYNGTVSQNVFIINETMNLSELSEFSNSGVKVNGETVWVKSSAAEGIIYYANGIAHEDISAAIQNKNLEKRVSKSLKSERIFLSDTIKADYLEVDTLTDKNETGIAKNGNTKVYLNRAESLAVYGTVIFDMIRDVRNAQGWQRAKSIMVYLDKINSISEFEEYIKIMGKASNGNIIITEEFAQKLIEAGKLNPVLEQLRKDGISVMIEKNAISTLPENVFSLFDGKFDKANKNIESSVPGEGTVKLDVDIINNAETMENSLGQAKGNVVIFASEIEKYVQSDRTGLANFLNEIMSVKVLKYFQQAEMTAHLARETGRNFDIEKILNHYPNITAENIEAMRDDMQQFDKMSAVLLNANKNFSIDKSGRADQHFLSSNGIIFYLRMIDSRVEDSAAADEIKRAYVEGLFERFAAAVEFKKAGRVYGFKNKNTERLVGQLASFKYTGIAVADAEAAAVRARIESMTSKNYNNEIASIVNEHPRAIPAVADLMLEMIFAYEAEVKMDKKDFKKEPNLKAMEAILKAA